MKLDLSKFNLSNKQKVAIVFVIIVALAGGKGYANMAAMAQAMTALAENRTEQVCLYGPYTPVEKIYTQCQLPAPERPAGGLSKAGVGEYESALVWCEGQDITIKVIGKRLGEPRCFKP